jgi:hypothetical protein
MYRFLHDTPVPTVTCVKGPEAPFTETFKTTGHRQGFAR